MGAFFANSSQNFEVSTFLCDLLKTKHHKPGIAALTTCVSMRFNAFKMRNKALVNVVNYTNNFFSEINCQNFECGCVLTHY